MLAQARVKTITVHTRKQAITIFQELKNKINVLYESQSESSLRSLLAIIRIIYYLSPMPKFLNQINTIGTLPVTVFLQNLLIKSKMIKFQFINFFQGWMIALLYRFEEQNSLCSTNDLKILKQIEFKTENYGWNIEDIHRFIEDELQISIQQHDSQLFGCLVILFRNFLVYTDDTSHYSVSSYLDWSSIMSSLSRGGWILNNMVREQTAICIQYYLCIRQPILSNIIIDNGIIKYLLQTLNSKFITQSFGKRIIQFIIFLLINGEYTQKDINIELLQQIISRFIGRYNNISIVSQARNLIILLDNKFEINQEQKIQKLKRLLQNQQQSNYIQILKLLSIISLYNKSNIMNQIIQKSHHQLYKFMVLTHHQTIAQLILELLASSFKNGALNSITGQSLVTKLYNLVADSNIQDKLIADGKKMLIQLVKIAKLLLENIQYKPKIIDMMKYAGLEEKLWKFSDFANYQYQKELLQFSQKLGNKKLEQLQSNMFTKLQDDLIMKSRTNFSKGTIQVYEQVKLLDNLYEKVRCRSQCSISSDLSQAVCRYVHVGNRQLKLLDSMQRSQQQQLRKKMNSICCRFILKIDNNINQRQRQKLLQLSGSNDEKQQVILLLNNFINKIQVQQNKKYYQNHQILQLLNNYFNTQSNVKFIYKLNDQQIYIIINQLPNYQSQENIQKNIKLLIEIAKKQSLCLEVFNKFSTNLAMIYNYLLSSPTSNKQPIILLDSLFCILIKLHIDLFYNDHFMSINYWIDILGSIDNYFEVYLTKKRIMLLELIFQFMQLNNILSQQNIGMMMQKKQRGQLLRLQAFHSRGQTLGYCISSLLPSFNDKEIQNLILQHKQNILISLQNNELINICKFCSYFYRICTQSLFINYKFQQCIQVTIKRIKKQLVDIDVIRNISLTSSHKLRLLHYYLEILFTINYRPQLYIVKALILQQQELLIDTLKCFVYYIQQFSQNQYKKYFIKELTSKIVVSLAHLYRHHFRYLKIKAANVIQYFQYLLGVCNQQGKDALCELMRVLLLKKQSKMMNCQIYNSCKEYRESLSAGCQQHIYYCEIIEHILYEDGDLEEQQNIYFSNTQNNRPLIPQSDSYTQPVVLQAYIMPQVAEKQIKGMQDKDISQKQQQLFLQFASEGSISKSQQNIPSNQIDNQSYPPQYERQCSQQTSIIDKLQQTWNESQLYQKIQQYLSSTQSNLLKPIFNQLTTVSSKKYYNLILKLFLKIKKQNKIISQINVSKSLQKIITLIPNQFCQIDNQFYEVLDSGIEGSRLGLKCKNIGLRGLQIYAKKFMNSINLQQTDNYAELLSHKKTFEQLKYLKNCKIYDAVNQKISSFINNNKSLTNICNLISQTCKYPPLCNSYSITSELCYFIIDGQIRSQRQILNVIKNLCKFGQKHKKYIQNIDFMSILIRLLQSDDNQNMQNIVTLLFLGSQENIQMSQYYQQMKLQQIILRLLKKYIQQDKYHHEIILNLLKILQILASLPQSSIRILKANFMNLCIPITKWAQKDCDFDLVGSLINILRNMLEEMELNLTKVVTELQKQGLLTYLLSIGPYLGRSNQIESYLGIYIKLLPNPVIGKKFIENLGKVLQILNDLARDQLLTQILLEQWMKVLFLLLQSNRYGNLPQILKSNIFFSSASCMRSFQSLSDKIINMNSRMMKQLISKPQTKRILALHGYADFLVQIIKMQNITLQEYLKILNTLSQLYKNHRFASKLCTQVFAVVIVKLQHHWKDQIAISSIQLLKNVKQKVQVTAQFGTNMIQFFGKFLSQSNKATSFQYYSISRQVICLLGYFLVFNQEIRCLFRNQIVINILRNWVRIAKALNYNEMGQIFKLFYYATFSNRELYMDLCEINSKRISLAENSFQKGWKCNLYRLNGTYKEAMIKIDRSKHQIIAFKNPDGVVKDKYRINLKDVLIIQPYQTDKDIQFSESVFYKSINPFQHKVDPTRCLTFLGLTDHFEVRQISIEAQNRDELHEIEIDAIMLISKCRQTQIQQQSKTWHIVNQRQ